ncbi:hypothetical protein CBI33_22755 [Rhodococcus erythropolis]|nr:hypothetical protein CBI33_22755 [Rhodococcus erythropolis]
MLVSPDCLGRTFNARVDGRLVRIDLPKLLPKDYDGKPSLVEPDWRYPLRQAEGQMTYLGAWGSVLTAFSTNESDLGDLNSTVWIPRVRISTASPDTREDAERIAAHLVTELAPWWDLTQSWVEIFTGQDLTPMADPYERNRLRGPELWTGGFNEHEVRQSLAADRPIEPPDPRQIQILTASKLEYCLKLASTNVEPPIEWKLARSAQSMLTRRDFRRAILDAGTAAELAIGILLDRRLKDVEVNVGKLLLARHRTLGQHIDLLKKLSGPNSLPDDIGNKLVNPRNLAAHGGTPPTRQVAVRAVETAVLIVESATSIESLEVEDYST